MELFVQSFDGLELFHWIKFREINGEKSILKALFR